MNTNSIFTRRIPAAAATTMLLLGATTLPASARQDPGEVAVSPAQTATHQCLLERVGTQYVRCDNLTGNGVQAPASLPEFGRASRLQGPQSIDRDC